MSRRPPGSRSSVGTRTATSRPTSSPGSSGGGKGPSRHRAAFGSPDSPAMPISILIRSAGRTEGAGADGKAASTTLPRLTFDGARLVLGRGPGCEVRVPQLSVSQRHATVRVEGASYALLDEGNTNGTFVGDVRL